MAEEALINWRQLANDIQHHAVKKIARGISFIENEVPGYEQLLSALPYNDHTKIIGITGPPGAGKSTLTDALIGLLSEQGKRIAVLCVDPSSPFNLGALLGDRIRMSEWYNHPDVFIRSLASRGSLGGLHPKIIEITELMKAAGYDYILLETVGVGQSEIEIAGLADATLVVLVPESGDEIQVMKAGIMEIADIFVVNKCDRPGAALFVKNLQARAAHGKDAVHATPIIQAVASSRKGIKELLTAIENHLGHVQYTSRKFQLLAQRAFHLIQEKRMKDVNKQVLAEEIQKLYTENRFNLYRFIADY